MAIANFSNIFKVPDLRRRVLYTLGMLAVYRVGAFISTPGVNRVILKSSVASKGSGMLGLLNMFSGGALENASLFALGIMPYVSASIVIQLLGIVYKPVDEMRKEGEVGRRRLDQYTRYGTILLAGAQSYGIAKWLESVTSDAGEAVGKPGLGFVMMTIITLTTGTAFLMWVGEQITERGVSNGISMLIFAGIVTGIPGGVASYLAQNKGNVQPLTIAAVITLLLVTVATIVFFERAQRRIPIVYSRRQVGKRIYGGQQAFLPLRVNTAGTIPPIFASSLLTFPTMLAGWGVWGMSFIQGFINRGDWVFNTGYVLLIVFFCFFYTAITFQAADVADNLKKSQANIAGIRPGRQTAEYIDRVLTRITFGGALYVAAVCVVPTIVSGVFRVPFRFGGTSIMIVVGVALDTVSQIEAHLISRNYETLAGPGGPRLRGRRDAA